MEVFYAVIKILAGCGAFLLGFKLLSDNMEKIAGNRLKSLFNKTSEKKMVGVGMGVVTTAVVQSSSITTVMVVGFVNAGIMSLNQAAAVIMGANVGTTITAQIVALQSFQVDTLFMAFTAVGVFMEPGVASLLLLVAVSMLSTWIARVFAYQKLLPGFTAPFILAVWLLQALCRGWFPSLLSSSVMPEETAADWFRAFSLNIGQVMFQGGTVLSGLFFLAGILLNSRVHALYTVWGALLPLGMVWMVGSDYAAFNAGLLGYNAVLCAIALGDRSWAGAAWATLSVTLSVLLQVWGMSLGMTTLTAPFVVSVWIVSGMRRALCRK